MASARRSLSQTGCLTVGFSQFMMGAAKNLLVLRGGVATSGPALVFPSSAWHRVRPRRRPSMQRFDRCARKLEPSGFLFPLARWVGLAVGCRLAANAGRASLPCRDHAAAVRTSAPGEYPNSFGDSVCPCRALAGSRRWAIIPFVSGGLEVTSGMRAVGRT